MWFVICRMVDDNKEIVMKLDFKQCLVSFVIGAAVMALSLTIHFDYFSGSNSSHGSRLPEPRPPSVQIVDPPQLEFEIRPTKQENIEIRKICSFQTWEDFHRWSFPDKVEYFICKAVEYEKAGFHIDAIEEINLLNSVIGGS